MKKASFLAMIMLLVMEYSYSQYPDKISIKLKDTLKSINDCVLFITLSKKDKQYFIFPRNYLVGNDDMNVDLMIDIQSKQSNNFKYYRCIYGNIAKPLFQMDSLILTKYKQLEIRDSLDSYECFHPGSYRIKVMLNKRRTDGKLDGPKIIASSNWTYFQVSREIVTFSYIENK